MLGFGWTHESSHRVPCRFQDAGIILMLKPLNFNVGDPRGMDTVRNRHPIRSPGCVSSKEPKRCSVQRNTAMVWEAVAQQTSDAEPTWLTAASTNVKAQNSKPTSMARVIRQQKPQSLGYFWLGRPKLRLCARQTPRTLIGIPATLRLSAIDAAPDATPATLTAFVGCG